MTFIRYIGVDFTIGVLDCVRYIEDFVSYIEVLFHIFYWTNFQEKSLARSMASPARSRNSLWGRRGATEAKVDQTVEMD